MIYQNHPLVSSCWDAGLTKCQGKMFRIASVVVLSKGKSMVGTYFVIKENDNNVGSKEIRTERYFRR